MNLIFDIGNVICKWDPRALVERLFATPGQQQEALRSVIQHQDWIELDKGLLEIDQALTNAAARCSLDKEALRQIYLETPVSLVPYPTVVNALRDLKSRGYPIFALSNMQRHSWDWLYPRYDFWSLFDAIVVSYEIGLVKPDQEIFEYMTGRYDLNPADSLFLDDMQINVEAARRHGMQCILVSDARHGIDDLYDRLGIQRTR